MVEQTCFFSVAPGYVRSFQEREHDKQGGRTTKECPFSKAFFFLLLVLGKEGERGEQSSSKSLRCGG